MELSQFTELHTLASAAYPQFDCHMNGNLWEAPSGHQVVAVLRGEELPYGFVSLRDRQLFIVFRGTMVRRWRTIPSPKFGPEWIRNAHFQPVDFETGKPHAIGIMARLFAFAFSGRYHTMDDPKWPVYGKTSFGFRKHYQPLRPDLLRVLAEHYSSIDRIFICGHSLGGALATLAIPDVISVDSSASQKLAVVTFASPRCVDRDFAKRLRDDKIAIYRVANSEDVVPYFPTPAYTPSGLPDKNDVGFEHVGVPKYFTLHTGTLGGNHEMETYGIGVQLAMETVEELSQKRVESTVTDRPPHTN
ncbi:lipase family protein [Aureliella helgolandensis]|nr:lipase family protein [Aureliella helgolandensis]